MTAPKSGRDSWFAAVFQSGWLWGIGLTFGFYVVVPSLPIDQSQFHRYFTAHWIEYATTGLFFIGLATVAAKGMRLPGEHAALAADLLEGLPVDPQEPALSTVERLENHLRLVAKRFKHSYLVQRLHEVCEAIRARRSAEGLDGQMTYLAELASGRQHDSYALIRTITWAVPILGFLGTVIGITLAIANITPDQLESSLGEVTAGLAVAFDTTALSLALSMVLVFATFIVERQEQQILDAIEDETRQRVSALFPLQAEGPVSPLLAAEAKAAEVLLEQTERMIAGQTQEWQAALEGLRTRWLESLERQQTALEAGLSAGLQQALIQQTQTLSDVRTEFVSAMQRAVEEQRLTWEAAQLATQQQQQAQLAAMQSTWQVLQSDLQATREAQAELWQRAGDSVGKQLSDWREALEQTQSIAREQTDELRQQGTVLLRIVQEEEQLTRLETRLAENLEAVRVVDSLEETMINLNAAVHLLTAKTRSKAA